MASGCTLNCSQPVDLAAPRNIYCAPTNSPFVKSYYAIAAWIVHPSTARAVVESYADEYVPLVLEAFVDLSYEAALDEVPCPLVTRELIADSLMILRPDLIRSQIEATVDFLIVVGVLKPVGTWLGIADDPFGDQVLLVVPYNGREPPGFSYEAFQRYVAWIYSLARKQGADAGTIDASYMRAQNVVDNILITSWGGTVMIPRSRFCQ